MMNRFNKYNKGRRNRKVRMIVKDDSILNTNNKRPRIYTPQNRATIFTNIAKPYGRSSRLFRPKSVKSDMRDALYTGGIVIIVSYCMTGLVPKLKILEAFITTLVAYGTKIKQKFDVDESIALFAIAENLKKNESITLNRINSKIIEKSKMFSTRKVYTQEFVFEILEKLENRDVIELRGNYLVLKEKIVLKSKT